jgi:hypothetical protein
MRKACAEAETKRSRDLHHFTSNFIKINTTTRCSLYHKGKTEEKWKFPGRRKHPMKEVFSFPLRFALSMSFSISL